MQQSTVRQSGSGGYSDRRRGAIVTRQELIFLILGGGNPTGVGLKLVNYSRTLTTNIGVKVLLIKAFPLSKESSHMGI